MNPAAIIIGTILAAYLVAQYRITALDRKTVFYPVFLASFPFYYFAFAIYAGDAGVLLHEIYAGSIFFLIAYIAYKLQSRTGVVLLALGYFGHAVYDGIHNQIFINNGTPIWWPEFCGAVDGLIGVYLIYLAISLKTDKPHS